MQADLAPRQWPKKVAEAANQVLPVGRYGLRLRTVIGAYGSSMAYRVCAPRATTRRPAVLRQARGTRTALPLPSAQEVPIPDALSPQMPPLRPGACVSIAQDVDCAGGVGYRRAYVTEMDIQAVWPVDHGLDG